MNSTCLVVRLVTSASHSADVVSRLTKWMAIISRALSFNLLFHFIACFNDQLITLLKRKQKKWDYGFRYNKLQHYLNYYLPIEDIWILINLLSGVMI
jgi:hypothetical protein